MDIHGNDTDRDVFGNSMNRDVFGNASNTDVHGNRPADIYGNYDPQPSSGWGDEADAASGDGGGLLDFLGNIFGSFFS